MWVIIDPVARDGEIRPHSCHTSPEHSCRASPFADEEKHCGRLVLRARRGRASFRGDAVCVVIDPNALKRLSRARNKAPQQPHLPRDPLPSIALCR